MRGPKPVTRSEIQRVLHKFPDRVVVLMERHGEDVPLLDKWKYVVPSDLTGQQFMLVIRNRLVLRKEQALFLMANSSLVPMHATMSQLKHQFAEETGALRLTYSGENVFG